MSSEIRDPVHGPVRVSDSELTIIDTPAYQRLRRIKQLGYGDLTFPGATHTRYLHSLGAMHLAGKAFEAIASNLPGLSARKFQQIRAAVRLSALLHDVGHAPLSHQLEYLLPPIAALDLPQLPEGSTRGQARHEHMTLLILLNSHLAQAIESAYVDLALRPDHVATILHPDVPNIDPDFFAVKGASLLPLAQQLVSGELDCDRMDYLRRDAYFAGVSYGNYDQDWILSNLIAVPCNGHYELGLKARALNTFEDFLLARYHMFMMVYSHQRTLSYDQMLNQFFRETRSIEALPSTAEAYLTYDDSTIHNLLLDHPTNTWAKRIVNRRPVSLSIVIDDEKDPIQAADFASILDDHEIRYLSATFATPLSQYCFEGRTQTGQAPELRIVFPEQTARAGVRPVAESTDLYERYRHTPRVTRFYVLEEFVPAYKELMAKKPF
jgi:hypothetical protein